MNEILSALIPSELANYKLPEPELLTYYKNIDDRIIWLEGELIDCQLQEVKQILRWNKEDENIPIEERKPIKILIFSVGGDLYTCFTILNIVKLSKTPVYTVNMGIAMSAGLLILLSGHKRFGLEMSQALIHSGSGSQGGTYEQTEAQMATYKKLIEMMRDFILKRTNIDLKLFNKNKSKDWYMFSEEQIKLGVVNKIVEDISEIL